MGNLSVNPIHPLARQLSAENLQELEDGLSALERSPDLLDGEHRDELLSAVFMLFLLDTVDYPEVEGVIRRAERLVASLGTDAVPMLLAQLDDSDIKSHVHLVRTLIQIGMPAVPQIIAYHDRCTDPMNRAFALYALSKMNDPGIAAAIPLAIKAMSSKHNESRDTATRSLGKMAEAVPAANVSDDLKREMFETAQERTTDPLPGVRAKALRTLGKLAVNGFLNPEQKTAAREQMKKALGLHSAQSADGAFLVRREAEIALDRLR